MLWVMKSKNRPDFIGSYVLSLIGSLLGILFLLEGIRYSNHYWKLIIPGLILVLLSYSQFKAVWFDVRKVR